MPTIFIFFCTIQYTTRTEMVNPCHQPCCHSKVWYGRTTLSGESGWISCSPNRYWSIAFRNFTSLSPKLIAWRLKTPGFDRFWATLRTNRLRMVARTETEATLNTDFNVCTLHRMSINEARMAPSIIGSHSRFSLSYNSRKPGHLLRVPKL